jgi:RNA polymerase sigma factor (sigma-70 family)
MNIESEDDRAYVASLYEKYAKHMKAIAYRILKSDYDAEDCVHETVVLIIRKLDTFKDIADESYLKWLILLVCKNTALNMYKRNQRRHDRETSLYFQETDDSDEALIDIPDTSALPNEIAAEEDQIRFIMSLIDRLDDKYRNVIMLKYRGWKNNDIADLLMISPEAVRQRLLRAKHMIMNMKGGNTL